MDYAIDNICGLMDWWKRPEARDEQPPSNIKSVRDLDLSSRQCTVCPTKKIRHPES